MRRRKRNTWVALCFLLLSPGLLPAAQQTKILYDFETPEALRGWSFKKKSGKLSARHATHGAKSLTIAPDEYVNIWKMTGKGNWSGYDSLEIDFFVEGNDPVGVYLLVGDADWKKKPTYWNRHNGGFNLKPGKNTISIPVQGLYRGEAGSRNNDLHYNIKSEAIVRVDFGFKPKGKSVRAIFMDQIRLVKESRPEGILAFDFGPESQTLFPGFTPIAWNTLHGQKGRKAGLKKACPSSNRARDDTFPTRLYQDFVWFQEGGNEFIADVPNGAYRVWVVFDDCGYWGGETCHHSKRWIEAEGKRVWMDDRGKAGPADYLFRFAKIEPRPGDSLWDLYVKKLFQPARFKTEVRDGALNLKTFADAPWSTKIAAVIVYPEAKKAEAEKWIAEIEARNRKEFESRAICVGPKQKRLDPPAEAQQKGWWLGFPALEKDVTFADAPGPPTGPRRRFAARGQRISFTFAVRPLKDFSKEKVSLKASGLKGPGKISASQVDLRYVHHGTRRGFNNIAYTIGPRTLRRVDGSDLRLSKDRTRQFWITVHVPSDAKPGVYSGPITLQAGALKEQIPLTVDVLDVKLDEPDYQMGFYGFNVPRWLPEKRKPKARRALFRLLKENGMNSFTGGPNIRFSGLDAAGKPKLDFGACDAFFRDAKAAGFTGPVMSYGGPGMVRGLHDGYVIGKTGRNWAKKTAKPFKELLKIVWGAVKEHAERQGWPVIRYGFTDEPRVLKQAQAQLELMKAYREAVPFVRIGGSYSVHWGRQGALGTALQEIFKTLLWSALNGHTQTDLDKAKQFKRELYIYNQGRSRYSFGMYQWAEMRKGVRGRFQWHLLALHGYQFFDLDGREPDTAMINWGRKEIIPTLALPRCREGADDLRFAVTLWNLAQKKKGAPEARAARTWLQAISRKIPVNARRRPKGLPDDETFRKTCVKHLKKLLALK